MGWHHWASKYTMPKSVSLPARVRAHVLLCSALVHVGGCRMGFLEGRAHVLDFLDVEHSHSTSAYFFCLQPSYKTIRDNH